MDIYVNNEKIDFTLEEERTLGEVVRGIGGWLMKENFSIIEMATDGEILEMPVGSVDLDRLISEIGDLHISASSDLENEHGHLSTIYEFFSIFRAALEEENEAALKEVLNELPNVLQPLDHLFGPNSMISIELTQEQDSGFAAGLAALIKESGLNEHVPQGDEKNVLMNYIAGILKVADQRIRELSSPLEELKITISTLVSMVPDLSEVSVLLQTGDDREAMNRVVLFADLSAKLIRLYNPLKMHGVMDSADVTVDGQTLQEYYHSTNAFLIELNDAFENNDSVLIGDLLEYEIAPKLAALSQLLEGLAQ